MTKMEKFLLGIVKKPGPLETACWLWRGKGATYGFLYFRGRLQSAHKAALELHGVEVPTGMVICHKCDVPGCCNPDHLFVGTYQDNSDDMKRKGRHNPTTKREEDRRSMHIVVKISPAEKHEIERRAEKAQRSVSDYVRIAALGTGPKNNAPG